MPEGAPALPADDALPTHGCVGETILTMGCPAMRAGTTLLAHLLPPGVKHVLPDGELDGLGDLGLLSRSGDLVESVAQDLEVADVQKGRSDAQESLLHLHDPRGEGCRAS